MRYRTAGVLFLTQGLFTAATIAAFTLGPVIAADLSGRDAAAGLPATLTLVGRAAIAYPVGWLMDRVGRRAGLSLGFFLGVLGATLSFWAVLEERFLVFLIGALFLGVMRGAGEQGRYAAAEVYRPVRRARVIGIIVFAGTIGAIGGPLLVGPSGQIARSLGFPEMAGPYVAAAGLLLLAFMLVFLALRPDPAEIRHLVEGASSQEEAASDAGLSLLTLFHRPMVQVAVLAMVVGQLVMTLLMVITPLYMAHEAHGAGTISLVIMAHTLGMFGLSGVTGWLSDRLGRVPVILAGGLILVSAALLAPVAADVPLLALALFLLGLGWNFCFVAGSTLLADVVATGEHGRVQGASEMVTALAAGVGSLGAGVLFEQAGIELVGAVGLFFSLSLIAVVLLRRLQKPQAASERL